MQRAGLSEKSAAPQYSSADCRPVQCSAAQRRAVQYLQLLEVQPLAGVLVRHAAALDLRRAQRSGGRWGQPATPS